MPEAMSWSSIAARRCRALGMVRAHVVPQTFGVRDKCRQSSRDEREWRIIATGFHLSACEYNRRMLLKAEFQPQVSRARPSQRVIEAAGSIILGKERRSASRSPACSRAATC